MIIYYLCGSGTDPSFFLEAHILGIYFLLLFSVNVEYLVVLV